MDIKDESGNINSWHHMHQAQTMEPCVIPGLAGLIGEENLEGFRTMPWFESGVTNVLPGPCLAMIARVRNPAEELQLKIALHSVSDLCEHAVVVLDSTSSNAAEDICEEAGAFWVRRPWNRDFSAARNMAAEIAMRNFPGARWHVVLDADEEFVFTPDIIELMEDETLDGIGVEVHIATDQGPVVQRRSIRAYRAGKGHWERRTHNELKGIERAQQSWCRVNTSYKGVMKERAERQLAVLMEDLPKDPNDPHTLKYLMRALTVLEHFDNAEIIANRLLGVAGDVPQYSDVYLHLASFARRKGDFGRAFGVLVEAIKRHSGNSELWRHLMGVCLQGWIGHYDAPSEYDGTSRVDVPDLHAKAAAAARMLCLPVTFREPVDEPTERGAV